MKHLKLRKVDFIVLFGLLALAAFAYSLHWAFTIDDAAISFSYARNFANGYGLGALYPGAPRVEGYSNLSWVVLLGILTRLGLETLLASKILGLFFVLGSIVLLYLSLRPFIAHTWTLIGIALVPLSLTFSFWSASGLENALYGFLILLSVYLLIIEEQRQVKIPVGSAISLIAVGMTRPEGVIYALAALGFKTVQLLVSLGQYNIPQRKQAYIKLLSWVVIFCLGYGLFKIWHLGYFAYLWPNPIYAKASWYTIDLQKIWFEPQGWVYLRGYFRTFGALLMIPALLYGALVSLKGTQRIFPLFALASLVLPLLAPDWMVNYRFLYVFIPFEVALLILAADHLTYKGHRLWCQIVTKDNNFGWDGSRKPRNIVFSSLAWLKLAALFVVAVFFTASVAYFAWANIRLNKKQLACGYEPWVEAKCIDGKNYWSMAEVQSRYTRLRDYANQVGIDDPLYLIPDIGATSYILNYRLIDLGALADIHLARASDHQTREQYLFHEQLPDFILTHSIWTRRTDLTALSILWDNYLPIEQRTDANGLIHGTFIRKDLLILDPEITIAKAGSDHSNTVAANKAQNSRDALYRSQELISSLELQELELSNSFSAGAGLAFDSYWGITQLQTKDWEFKARLIDQEGNTIAEHTGPLGYGWYPTSLWEPGELIRQYIHLPITQKELVKPVKSNYIIEISIIDPATGNQTGTPATYQGQVDDLSSDVFYRSSDALATQQEKLLADAQSAWLAGDLEQMLIIAKQSNQLRGRAHVQPGWLAFGKTLRLAADQAANQNDWQRAYQLYYATTLSNPGDAWAQRGLEETRKKGAYVQ